MRTVAPFVVLLVVTGCVPYYTYEQLRDQYENLRDIHKNLRAKIDKWKKETIEAKERANAEYKKRLLAERRLQQLLPRISELEKSVKKWRMGVEKNVKTVLGNMASRVQVTESGAIAVEGEFLFAAGSDKLRPQAKPLIDKLAKLLTAHYKDYFYRIDGHTDDQPIRRSPFKSNWHLSVMRALSVLEALKKAGVPEEKMFIAGFGEFKPRVPNRPGRKGHPLNRRVEITIVKTK